MMISGAAAHARGERADFVHVTLRRVEETEALRRYIQDRVDRQSSKGPEVLWYEVVVHGDRQHRRPGPYSARVTAHLRHKDVFAAQTSQDTFLAVRDVFDVLAEQLWRVRDVRKSLSHGASGNQHNSDRNEFQ